jgi:hypothetical protein
MHTVAIIYLKGGGEKVTRNFEDTCSSLAKLSRFVVLAYEPFDGASPLTASLPDGNRTVMHLYFEPKHLLCERQMGPAS